MTDMNNFVNAVKLHVQRAFMCQLRQAIPSENEGKVFTDSNVNHDIVQSYYVWRRSCLFVSTPFLCIGMILGFVDLGTTLQDASAYLNFWGKVLQVLGSIDTSLLFAAIIYAIVQWNQFTKSVTAVSIGWLITFCVPLLQAFFPLEMIVKDDVLDLFDDATIVSLKVQIALGYALTLLPVIVTFPGGAVRASIRIRWLLEHSSLAGWILILCAPFYSIVLCISLVLVMQLAGNGVLLIGMLLIVCAPWMYIVRAKLFVGVWDDVAKDEVQKTQRIIGVASLSGYALIVIWMFTAEVAGVSVVGSSSNDNEYSDSTYLLSYGQAFRMILETVGRLLVTTVLFCDAILRMSVKNWVDDIERRKLIGDDANDGFQEIVVVYGINPPINEDETKTQTMVHPTNPICDATESIQGKTDSDHDEEIGNKNQTCSNEAVETVNVDRSSSDRKLHIFLQENLERK